MEGAPLPRRLRLQPSCKHLVPEQQLAEVSAGSPIPANAALWMSSSRQQRELSNTGPAPLSSRKTDPETRRRGCTGVDTTAVAGEVGSGARGGLGRRRRGRGDGGTRPESNCRGCYLPYSWGGIRPSEWRPHRRAGPTRRVNCDLVGGSLQAIHSTAATPRGAQEHQLRDTPNAGPRPS